MSKVIIDLHLPNVNHIAGHSAEVDRHILGHDSRVSKVNIESTVYLRTVEYLVCLQRIKYFLPQQHVSEYRWRRYILSLWRILKLEIPSKISPEFGSNIFFQSRSRETRLFVYSLKRLT